MSDLIELRCPNCGAPLKVEDDDAVSLKCPFCSTVVMIPPELRRASAHAAAPGQPDVISGSPETDTPRRKRSSLSGCLFLALLLVGIGVAGALIESPTRSLAITGGPLAAVTPTAEPIQRELTAALPREVDYGGFGIQITGGVIDNRREINDSVMYLPDRAFARLDGTLKNLTRENLYLDPQLFRLRLADGRLYSLDPGIVLSRTFSAPDPGASAPVSFAFSVPYDAVWDGAVLVVTDGSSEPAELPLTGDAPKTPYPVILPLPDGGTVDATGITFQVTGASLGLDDGSRRAARGTRFLYLDLHMTNSTGRYGLNVSSDSFRVTANGSTTAPVDAPIAVIDYQSSLDGRAVFAIPADAKSVQVQFGDVRKDPPDLAEMALDIRQP